MVEGKWERGVGVLLLSSSFSQLQDSIMTKFYGLEDGISFVVLELIALICLPDECLKFKPV